MELSQMRFFLEVAKNQHITKSAEKLHIAQPSLTQSMHRLEETLGVPLFLRKGRNIVLTEYGRFLEGKLAPIVAEIDRIPFELQSMAKCNSETIHMNVLAASTLITDAIIRYRQEKSHIHFQLRQNPNAEDFDIEVTTKLFYQHSPEENDPGRRCFVRTENIFLAVPNSEKFKGRTSIHLRDVMDEGFICLSGSRQFRLVCDKICHQIGFRPNIIFESDSPAAVMNMVASNMGVGFYPEFSWGPTGNKHIRLLRIEDAVFRRDLIVRAVLDKADNENLLDFYRFLENYIGSNTP